MTPEMKTWWGAVPDRTLVAARRSRRRDTFYAYRYGTNGRWLWFDGEWDYGPMCWSWKGVDDATDAIIIARDVLPAVSRGVVAELCGLDCDGDRGRAAVTFGRMDRILWDDIQPGMAVMVEGGHVVYRLPSGNGVWVRHACESWWGIGAGWQWRSHEVHGAGNGGVCAVMATGVEPTDDAIRAAVGGLSAVVPNQTVEWFADKCRMPCGSHEGRSTLSAIEFERGNRIAWDDVRTSSVVQIQSGAVAYRHSNGTGSWARCPPSETGGLREAGVQWPWRHLHHGGWEWAQVKSRIGKTNDAVVMATGVAATIDAIRAAVAGELTVLTIPEWTVKS